MAKTTGQGSKIISSAKPKSTTKAIPLKTAIPFKTYAPKTKIKSTFTKSTKGNW